MGIFNKEERELRNNIEELTEKYVDEKRRSAKLEDENLIMYEQVEKYKIWKKNTKRDIEELIFYIENHLNIDNEKLMINVINDLERMMNRSLH